MNSGKVRALALRAAFIAPLCLLVGATAQADINVPAGAWASLGGGSMDLGCTDLIVSGNYDLGGGAVIKGGIVDSSIDVGDVSLDNTMADFGLEFRF